MQMFRPVGKLAGFGTITVRPPIVPAAAEVSDVTSFFLGSLRLHWPWPHREQVRDRDARAPQRCPRPSSRRPLKISNVVPGGAPSAAIGHVP
jgi:hypothetical protein